MLCSPSVARRRAWKTLPVAPASGSAPSTVGSAARTLNSLLDEINEICEELDIDPRGFFFSGLLGATPPQSVHAFIAGLPSAFAWATLRHCKHRDLTHPWEQHDWTDISALSVAVPYCDVVITERRWAHMIKATRLAERHKTEVGHWITALESLFSTLS